MKVGLQLNRFTWKGGDKNISDNLSRIATSAEENGFYSLWVMDHFFQIHYIGEYTEPMLEAYTTLGFLAGITKKVKLGTMVTGVIYRDPALLIKAVSTLDVLSKGRAYFGIGAAWNEEESRALGFNFPPLKERFERLEETLQIAKQMFTGDTKPFIGKHYKLETPFNSPQVLQKPHPPILIGGGGEQKTLKFVAKYGDACNLFVAMPQEELIHKLNVLKEHCKNVGRNYDEIEKTGMVRVMPNDINPKKLIEECKRIKELGFDHMIANIVGLENADFVKVFGEEIIPEVSKL